MFAVDKSRESCVVVCRDCGWRGIARDRQAAWRLAADHEGTAHPGQFQATDRVSWEKRRDQDLRG